MTDHRSTWQEAQRQANAANDQFEHATVDALGRALAEISLQLDTGSPFGVASLQRPAHLGSNEDLYVSVHEPVEPDTSPAEAAASMLDLGSRGFMSLALIIARPNEGETVTPSLRGVQFFPRVVADNPEGLLIFANGFDQPGNSPFDGDSGFELLALRRPPSTLRARHSTQERVDDARAQMRALQPSYDAAPIARRLRALVDVGFHIGSLTATWDYASLLIRINSSTDAGGTTPETLDRLFTLPAQYSAT